MDTETKLSSQEIIERYAQINNISIEQAQQEVGAETAEEILKNISAKTVEKINSTRIPMNRAERRALKKKVGEKKYAELMAQEGNEFAAVSDAATKLNYIDLIQKLRKLNEEKENEENGSCGYEMGKDESV